MADRIVVMDQGVIAQVGTPIEIYRHPVTRFVADFVGTMNFLPGVVVDRRRVRLGRLELDCAGGLQDLEPGAAVTVCIRPEDLAASAAGPDTRNAAVSHVEEVEFLGPFHRARLAIDGLDGIAVTADFPPALVRELAIDEDAEITVVFPEDRIHVFAGG
jgi:iron(III) transport system ATP-binding protein